MKNITTTFIVVLILVSVLGILISQGWLLYKQYQYAEQIHQDKVHNLLMELGQDVDNAFKPKTDTELSKQYFLSVNKEDKSYYAQFILEDNYSLYKKNYAYQIDTNLVRRRRTDVKNFLQYVSLSAPGIDTVETLIVSYRQEPKIPAVDINSTDYFSMEGLLVPKMKAYNINVPFHYGLRDNTTNTWLSLSAQADTLQLLASPHTRSFLENTEQLFLIFPHKTDFFINQLIMHILGSILVLGFVFVSFWYILSIILEQKKLSELKTDFINNMTHEFKTPIATIDFAVANIENEKILQQPAAILKFIDVIKKENRRMNRQVEQVLEAAIADRKALKLHLVTFDLHEVIYQISTTAEVEIKSKQGNISRMLQAKQTKILGDKVQLANVISNLLDNAQKYSPNPPIITIHTKNTADTIAFSISDQGKGMTEEEQEKVFEKFYRVPTGNLHKVKGFGLGLSYAKAVIEQHEGHISLTSKLGKGSTFTVTLPLKK